MQLTEDEQKYIRQNRHRQTVYEVSQALNKSTDCIRWFLRKNKLDYKRVHTEHYQKLTARENEIMELVAQGLSNLDISEKLKISISTVSTHLLNIYTKYSIVGSNSSLRVQATLRYLQDTNRLTTPERIEE